MASSREERSPRPVRREVGHDDRPARPAHAKELVRDCSMVRREDRAEARRHDVERGGSERERLRVGLDPLDLDTPGVCLSSAGCEVLGGHVRCDNVGPRLGRADRDVARSRRNVEHAVAGRDAGRLDQHGPELQTVSRANRW